MATRRSELAIARAKAASDFVMLAHKFNPKKHTIDKISGWRIEEKIDGIRARWHEGRFVSRSMKPFPTPSEVLLEMEMLYGDLALDGELSLGRGKFQKSVSAVRNGHSTLATWNDLTYHVFDYYDPARSYDDRIEILSERFRNHPMVEVLKPLGYVRTIEDIHQAHDKIKALGGEGLILRNPDAPYQLGRSWDLLKVKSFIDKEFKIVGYTAGEGRHEGRIGALKVWDEEADLVFKAGSGLSDYDRENPPSIGAMVTLSYFELTDLGIPRFPVYKGVRDYE